MALSRARKTFRVILGLMLMLSTTFFGTAVYFYHTIKQDRSKLAQFAPTLFQIDVYQYQAKAMFTNTEGKHEIASALLNQGFYSPVYSDAGLVMMKDLAEHGYAPSQTVHASLLLRHFPPAEEKTQEAVHYYRLAAAQGYAPAQEILIALDAQKFAQNQ